MNFLKPRPVLPEAPGPACEMEDPSAAAGFHAPPIPLAGDPLPYDRAPKAALWLGRALSPLDRAFDYAYTSGLNPLYKSGTLAVGLMALAVATGVLLLFWYRVGAPYESMAVIQSGLLMRLTRGVHRYASDLAVVAVAFHMLRMAAEGKAWGPRVLAWVSGVVLLGMMLVIGWTGYVLVWDDAGVALALAAARLLDALPFFSDPISRAFNGSALIQASFYFMTLFLHMSLPLMLLLFLWIHTAKLARSSWLPRARSFAWISLALALAALAWPAPLGSAGDLLQIGSRYALDGFYNAWLPLAGMMPALWFLALAAGGTLALASMPWWWRPKAARRPQASFNDPSRCEGCNQCVLDCPFEAVALVARPSWPAEAPMGIGTPGSTHVAVVDPQLCVSCGLCVGSCDRLSIAPPDRDARAMLAQFGQLKKSVPEGGLAFFYCRNNELGQALAAELSARAGHVAPYPLDCLGQLHSLAALSLLKHFKGLLLHGCPPSMCRTREGYQLVVQRLEEGRKPTPPGLLDKERIKVLSQTSSEKAEALAEIDAFLEKLGLLKIARPSLRPRALPRQVAAGALTLLLMAGMGWLSNLKAGKVSDKAWLRLAWRLPGQALRQCRPYTPEEMAGLPAHMRRKEKCETRYLSYDLKVKVDGKEVFAGKVRPQGSRGDRPLVVDEDLEITAGRHSLEMEFLPEGEAASEVVRLKGKFSADFVRGRALLLSTGPDGQAALIQSKAE